MKIKEFINKIWFPIFIIIIVLIYFLQNHNIAIIIAVIGIIALLIQIIYEWMKNRGFSKRLTKYLRVDDRTISNNLDMDIVDVQAKMSEILQSGLDKVLIIKDKNTYISYNNKMEDVMYKILIVKGATAEDAIRVLSKHGIEKKTEIELIKKALNERRKSNQKE